MKSNPMLFLNILSSTATKHSTPTLFLPQLSLHRSFVNARIKWVRDPFLDFVVEREKNLKPCLSVKNLLLSSSSSLPISVASLHKPHLNLPSHTTSLYFFHKYPSLFTLSPPNVQITPQFFTLHKEEEEIYDSMLHKEFAAQRLARLLMITKICRIPIAIIDDFKFDLGLPDNYVLELVSYLPEYFRIGSLKNERKCDVGINDNGERYELGLELISWKRELCVPAILKRGFGDNLEYKRGNIVKFPMNFAPGFDLQKKVSEWVEEWQCLSYVSPYENAFHLAPQSDQAEKWTVAVLHEILSLLVSKKTEMKNILRLGDYLGFGLRFKQALVHHPGIFYISNKIKTQTVVLREAFRKHMLLENHPLMGMRHSYIYLMNKSRKGKKSVRSLDTRCSFQMSRSDNERDVFEE